MAEHGKSDDSRAQPALESPPPPGVEWLCSRQSPYLFCLTVTLRVIAAVCVQLKAVLGRPPQYVVFYYLTRPRFRR